MFMKREMKKFLGKLVIHKLLGGYPSNVELSHPNLDENADPEKVHLVEERAGSDDEDETPEDDYTGSDHSPSRDTDQSREDNSDFTDHDSCTNSDDPLPDDDESGSDNEGGSDDDDEEEKRPAGDFSRLGRVTENVSPDIPETADLLKNSSQLPGTTKKGISKNVDIKSHTDMYEEEKESYGLPAIPRTTPADIPDLPKGNLSQRLINSIFIFCQII